MPFWWTKCTYVPDDVLPAGAPSHTTSVLFTIFALVPQTFWVRQCFAGAPSSIKTNQRAAIVVVFQRCAMVLLQQDGLLFFPKDTVWVVAWSYILDGLFASLPSRSWGLQWEKGLRRVEENISCVFFNEFKRQSHVYTTEHSDAPLQASRLDK